MSLTDGVFESVLKICQWSGSTLQNRSIDDAFALRGGGARDGEFDATARLYCPFTAGLTNYGFHYNNQEEAFTPILESHLVRVQVPFALVELARE